MLELKHITKVYKTADLKQKALNDVNVSFRKNEFASILGPSGSGKTTLLNIIGGLDKYTNGDLIINGISTKKYKDSDWDSYRNHRIGFVFQNYNLISHQSVLQNVVLALKLSGISKKEAITRAKRALKEVGLEAHMNKKPNQLSGGQMQRVAIARALVNNPDILLADEPTGALDSETSIQIMNLLKKIASDKLVIMVTHNPDLANEYSNRIITLKDGKITSDTNPYNTSSKEKDGGKVSKTTMSFLTALSLSFNNLMTKKGRTVLVSLAGSIGIIGIALILALSTGFQNYIDKLQEDTLSSYPLTIYEDNADMTQMLLSMMGSKEDDTMEEDKVYERQFVSSMFGNVSKNDLKNFKKYLENNYKIVENDISSIHYGYSVSPLIYSKYNKKIVQLNPSTLFSSFGNSIYSNYSNIYTEMTDDIEMLEENFEVLAGTWPKNYDELIIVLTEPHTIADMLVYYLGLRDPEELNDMVNKMMAGETVDVKNKPFEFTYEELMNVDLRLINNTDIYKYNSKYKIYEDMSEDESYMKNLYDKATKLKIVGIVCSKDGNASMALQNGMAYTSKLTKYIIDHSKNTDVVKKQLSNKNTDVFSNTDFDSNKTKSNLDFEDLIKVDKDLLSSAFNVKIDEKDIESTTSNYMNEISSSITADISPAKKDFDDNLKEIATSIINNYIENPKELSNFNIPIIYNEDVDNIVSEYIKSNKAVSILSNLENKYIVPSSVFESTYSSLISGMLKGYITVYNTKDKTYTKDESNPAALIMNAVVEPTVNSFMEQALVKTASSKMAEKMTEAVMQKEILTKVGELTGKLMSSLGNAFDVDPAKIASAFKFDLSEDELKRIMSAMTKSSGGNAKANLVTLGYQNIEEPSSIAFYFKSFDSKEHVVDFIDNYNKKMESSESEDKVINYTDTTGILMGSVKKIVNSVSYVLIAFVSISLVVSSIMIGIITYISVIERTKEIGILRAIGASKRNISSIFNAETFIIGLLSGVIGIGITLSLIPIINFIIHKYTENININATISMMASIILIVLSIILTLIGGLIPSRKAAKKDPVEALRSE